MADIILAGQLEWHAPKAGKDLRLTLPWQAYHYPHIRLKPACR